MSLAPKHISVEDFKYNLPENRIAKYPLEDRETSKLLVYMNAAISECCFTDIATQLPENTLLVFNNTKVIFARLLMHKKTGAQIEIFCLEPSRPCSYELVFQERKKCVWKAIVGNSKKWKDETLQKEIFIDDEQVVFYADRVENNQTHHLIEFSWSSNHTFGEILDALGTIPIPPYLNRDSENIDKQRYQTVFSKYKGSVAAPTAGLHFSSSLLEQIQKQYKLTELTLHVGAGTFKPVQAKSIGEHEMHTEYFSVSVETLQCLLDHEGTVIPVGTTSLRTLESIFWLGVGLLQNGEIPHIIGQWDVYNDCTLTLEESISALITYLKKQKLQSISARTQIIIAPGYSFRVASALLTNFHQPASTLLLLVSAMVGDKWKDIYAYALENNFRFLSYGDSSLLFPE